VAGDLRTAKVYYLVFGKAGADPRVQAGLTSAAGFLRNALSKSLMIRHTPTLSFELDTSIEHGVRLTQLIDRVNKPRDDGGDEGGGGGDGGGGSGGGGDDGEAH
jgi:ribosome-binding factor A